ncbi:unnamed protein product [Ectocarpus sp. 4 AP-2014]
MSNAQEEVPLVVRRADTGGMGVLIMRLFLISSTVMIYVQTVIAIVGHGWLWPIVCFQDLTAKNWRSQFDSDFVVYLILSSCWIVWREGSKIKSYFNGFLNMSLGGMFGFPYLLIATYSAKGDIKKVVLGIHA